MRLSAIGDVCHAVSTVQAIQKQYPNASITWVIGKIEQKLLQGLAGIDFVVFDKSLGIKAYSKLKQDMRGKHFDVLLHMQLALRANIAAFFIPAKVKIGFSKARSKELHSLFVNKHIEHEQGMHVLDGFRDFARAIGVEDSSPQWNIPVDETVRHWAQEKLPAKKYIVISPAASKAERNWLNERYAAIANYCSQKGFDVVITGGPSDFEQQLALNIIKQCQHPVINLVGQTNLKQLLLTLQQAQCVIAPDSGPAHMAVTQGTPVIGLYAHSNPRRTGPYLYQQYVVDAYSELACKALQKPIQQIPWGYRLKGDHLMATIEVEQVITVLDRMIKDLNHI
ncbi:MAG: glycosyltransferase family 9 protein [Kangiellaceae bacterium]|nr:glycosyltransferase family 9 protein [Kangiellaceae bacterium]